jgi:2-isopropylmalate synthase
VYDEDIMAVVDDEIASSSDRLKLKNLSVFAGTEGPQKAEITLEIDGVLTTNTSTGDGPVDAIFNSIKALFPHKVALPLYQVQAVTEGTDAQAEVSVRLEDNGTSTIGRSADTDTLVASARAYLNALNKLLAKAEKEKKTKIDSI